MGKSEPRLTQQTLSVLGTLARGQELPGVEISKMCGLATGTLYPILYRLEEYGWLDSRWEAGDPATLGRPRRRYYRITGEGVRKVDAIIGALMPREARFA
jgi:DNA-binding PadR family transcriptional regulator